MGSLGTGIQNLGAGIAQRIGRKKEDKSLEVVVSGLKKSIGEEEFAKTGIQDVLDATKGQDNRFKKMSDYIAIRQALQKQETPDEKRYKDLQIDLAKEGIEIDTKFKDFNKIANAVNKSKTDQENAKQKRQFDASSQLNEQRADLSARNQKQSQENSQQFQMQQQGRQQEFQRGQQANSQDFQQKQQVKSQEFQGGQQQGSQEFQLQKEGVDASQGNPFGTIASAVRGQKELQSRQALNQKLLERGQSPVDVNDPAFMAKAQAGFAMPDLSKTKSLEEQKVKNKGQMIGEDVDKILNIVNTSNIGLEKSKGLIPEASALFNQARVSSNIPLLTANSQNLSELQSALGSLKRNASFSDAGKALTDRELSIISPLLDISGKTSQRISEDLGKFKTEWSRLSNLIDGKSTTGASTSIMQSNSNTGSTIDKYFEGL